MGEGSQLVNSRPTQIRTAPRATHSSRPHCPRLPAAACLPAAGQAQPTPVVCEFRLLSEGLCFPPLQHSASFTHLVVLNLSGQSKMRPPLAPSLVTAAILALVPCLSRPQSKQSRTKDDTVAAAFKDLGKGINSYSIDAEKKLGGQLAQEVERSSKPIDDPETAAYFSTLEQTLKRNLSLPFPIAIRVLDSDLLNAFTLPGGYQYINRGLILETEDEAELAGVLAHGIAHTALRTATKAATKGELMQLATTPAMIFIPYSMAGYAMYQGSNLAIPLTFLKFSRDVEIASDYYGLQFLYQAGYDPESYARLMGRVLPKISVGKNIPKVFDPFPPPAQRLAYLRKEIAQILPPRGAAAVSSSGFQSMKEHLRSICP
jgi:predicted Zn-dependent protease